MQYETITMSAGVDSNYGMVGRYEYVLFDQDENVVARATGFRSKAQAKREGVKAAQALLVDPLIA